MEKICKFEYDELKSVYKKTNWKLVVYAIFTHKKSEPLSVRFSDLVRIQTWNLLIRSQMLYSIELRGHYFFNGLQI